MKNMNEADLGLAVGITNQWKNSNTTAGAGANANSMADLMTFVGPDTVAELVWSPRAGLHIKFADKKPRFMWEVGPSDTELLQPEKNIPGEDKETSFKCRENDEKQEVESHGSMKSCKSANLLTKRKRRLRFEKPLILGSKRIKKLDDHESVVKKDSSFTNWISNMVKNLKNHENYDERTSFCDGSRSFESRKTGFRNVFESLLSPGVKTRETIAEIKNKSNGSSKDNERLTKEALKGIFDAIRRLRLSRTDILKWTYSRLSVSRLDGFFLRLRLAKSGGSRYYVACIKGLHGEHPWKGFKKRIRVKVGGVECFVESQYISNCDFLEDELVAWCQNRSKDGGTPLVKDLESKLAERRRLGL